MGSLMLLAALLVLAISVWAAIFIIRPAIGRAEFSLEMTRIRDEVDDAVIAGQLRNDPAVRAFIERAEHFIDHPQHVSASLLIAIHQTLAAHQDLPDLQRRHSFAHLSSRERRLMHQMEHAEAEAVARRIVAGSSCAVPWAIAKLLFGRKGAQRIQPRTTPRPQQLARELQKLPDRYTTQFV